MAAELRVYGRVQGVCFRDSTRVRATELGVRGRVRNEPDGSVFVHIEGDAEAVEELVRWCAEGPPLARVDRVARRAVPPLGLTGFRVTF